MRWLKSCVGENTGRGIPFFGIADAAVDGGSIVHEISFHLVACGVLKVVFDVGMEVVLPMSCEGMMPAVM